MDRALYGENTLLRQASNPHPNPNQYLSPNKVLSEYIAYTENNNKGTA